jgi:hypothetical protein
LPGTVLNSGGSYADPPWLTSLAGSKISGTVAQATHAASADTATLAAAASSVLNGVYTTGSYADPMWMTALDAGKLNTGTMKDARLSSNVPLRNGGNIFTAGTQDFSGAGATLPIKAVLSSATPTSCVASKELLVKTDAVAGQQVFICNAAGNGWALVGDGASTGTVTSVGSGAGLTGGPIIASGALSIASHGVTNAMLQNSSVTVTAGTGLTGGGSVALGGSTTLSLNPNFSVTTGTFAGNNATQIISATQSGSGAAVAGTKSASGATGLLGTSVTLGSDSFPTGVYGTGSVWGVYGNSTGTSSGSGTVGIGANIGVWGTGGNQGVWGAHASNGSYGQLGTTVSGSATGVRGDGSAYGVYGSSTGTGVYGSGGTGVSGNGALQGVAGSSGNVGVYGVNSGTNSYGALGLGVYVYPDTYPTGVYGQGTGLNSYGVWGEGYTGVFGKGSNYGVSGSSSSVGVAGYGGTYGLYGYGTTYGVYGYSLGSYAVYASGNFAASGTKSAVVALPDDRVVELYAMESPENWFEDFGGGVLQEGIAQISLDPTFALTVNTDAGYRVFLTPSGDCEGLYVTKKTATGFQVRELRGGKSNVAFDYRIVAKRRGYESVRMDELESDTTTAQAIREQVQRRRARRKLVLPMHTEAPQVEAPPIAPSAAVVPKPPHPAKLTAVPGSPQM